MRLRLSFFDRGFELLKLFKDYHGEYVAIVNGRVVDHDEDLQALGKRVLGRYPAESLYVTCVGTPRRIGVLEL
ncbi:MAG: DUF5678 domain-containing protein [Candidatus Bathyarchaeia archaeon]